MTRKTTEADFNLYSLGGAKYPNKLVTIIIATVMIKTDMEPIRVILKLINIDNDKVSRNLYDYKITFLLA